MVKINAANTSKLIQSHKNSRKHLLELLNAVDEDKWFEMVGEAKWSIQRAATHILNAEIMWMSRKSGEEPNYLGRKTSLQDFYDRENNIAEEFYQKVKQEENDDGFLFVHPDEGTPSYHWSMVRCIQHAIYHSGMISLIRQQLGYSKISSDTNTWPPMVDSLFEVVLE